MQAENFQPKEIYNNEVEKNEFCRRFGSSGCAGEYQLPGAGYGRAEFSERRVTGVAGNVARSGHNPRLCIGESAKDLSGLPHFRTGWNAD